MTSPKAWELATHIKRKLPMLCEPAVLEQTIQDAVDELAEAARELEEAIRYTVTVQHPDKRAIDKADALRAALAPWIKGKGKEDGK